MGLQGGKRNSKTAIHPREEECGLQEEWQSSFWKELEGERSCSGQEIATQGTGVGTRRKGAVLFMGSLQRSSILLETLKEMSVTAGLSGRKLHITLSLAD